MQQYSYDLKLERGAIFWCSLLTLLVATLGPPCNCSERHAPNLQQGQLSNLDGILEAPDKSQATSGEFVTAVSPRNLFNRSLQSIASGGPNTGLQGASQPKQVAAAATTTPSESDGPGARNKARKQEEVLSEDCFAKRDEVLKRQSGQVARPTPAAAAAAANPSAGFQRIKARARNGSHNPVTLNVSLVNNFDGEHVPRCRPDGSYDPVQCHKIGYCWCVNKFGQAIKNSAVGASEEPECDLGMYDSDSNNRFVVANMSAQRINSILRNGSFVGKSSTPDGHINLEASAIDSPTALVSESPGDQGLSASGTQQAESASSLGSGAAHGPVMPLMPNDCSGSRASARKRAATQINDSIWVPECDIDDERLYAEQQCHKSRVCWCVDQTTGLPLRTNEQLSSRPMTHNCTEIKRILGLQSAKPKAGRGGGGSVVANSRQQQQQQQQQSPHHLNHQAAFYQGSSEYCDTDKRLEFVVTLNNQFRQQISEYLRQNPSSSVPTDLNSSNPYLISEAQVAKWKFAIMDRDMDGKIGDREWSKFKNNFKLVDKVSELDNPYKQQKSPYFSLTPLLIVRSQRKCWRDFLEFCGNGELVDESISLSMWMGCTEVPPRSNWDERGTRTAVPRSENTYALSREAAIVRSQKKNPFLGILKPD